MEKAADAEMLKWLDVLLDFDPSEDADVIDMIEDAGELEMHEADEKGDLAE